MRKETNQKTTFFSMMVWDRMSFTKQVQVFFSMSKEDMMLFDYELRKKRDPLEEQPEYNFFNLRHVVFELCHDNSLTPEQLAK